MKKSFFISLVFSFSFNAFSITCPTVKDNTNSFKIERQSLFNRIKIKSKHILNLNCIEYIGDIPKKKFLSGLKEITFSKKLASKTIQCQKSIQALQFNEIDFSNPNWRPQGISFDKDLIYVSWYNRKMINGDFSTENGPLGQRISIINRKSLTYEHFRVLDKEGKPIIGHSDGISSDGNILYLANYNEGIYVFDLNSINLKNSSITPVAHISSKNCRFKMYRFGNLSFKDNHLYFTNYSTTAKDSMLFKYSLNENKIEIDLTQKLPSNIQGYAISGAHHFFISPVTKQESFLHKINDNNIKTFTILEGAEDLELLNQELMTVTEFENKRYILDLSNYLP